MDVRSSKFPGKISLHLAGLAQKQAAPLRRALRTGAACCVGTVGTERLDQRSGTFSNDEHLARTEDGRGPLLAHFFLRRTELVGGWGPGLRVLQLMQMTVH